MVSIAAETDRFMGDSRWERMWEVYNAAVECPSAKREAWLEEACEGDPELRREVDELLAARAASDGFMDTPATAVGALDDIAADSLVGTRLGPYHLTEAIGEGGVGVVYQAEQSEPVRRSVAVKLIKMGMNTREVVSRFESERQALAMMDHPGIAKVFDAGVSDDGRPYFVMERVSGLPITRFCDEQRLSIRERLQLFSDACLAVQHAHQNGIIHRDLKPSNILVSRVDGRPAPKVIDFGIAKAINHTLAEQTFYTEHGRLIGTPEYMSPEQAAMRADIDTRTDIYSLGVILYELLSGVLPYESDSLSHMSYGEIQRVVCETRAAKPSARLARLEPDDAARVAGRRRCDTRALLRRLRDDLDSIVQKALEKEPPRRYPGAFDIAADIGRHLDGKPVLASPPSRLYHARKFVARHKVGAVFAITLMLAIIGFGVVTSIQSAQLRRALERESHERAQSEQIASLLVDLFDPADPTQARSEITAREMLDQGVERVAAELDEQPELKAAVLHRAAEVYVNLGMLERAETLIRDALAQRRNLYGPRNPLVAASMQELAQLLLSEGDYADAEDLAQQTLAVRRDLFGGDHPLVAETLNLLGWIALEQVQLERARTLLTEALTIRRRHQDRVAESLKPLSYVQGRLGDFVAAQASIREAIDIQGRQDADSPRLASMLGELGSLLHHAGDYAQAIEVHRQALAHLERVLGEDHPLVAQRLDALGAVLYDQGEYEQAEAHLSRALDIRRRMLGPEHPHMLTVLNNLALVLQEKKDYARAEEMYLESVRLLRKLHGEDHWLVGSTLNNLGWMLYNKGDDARAEQAFVESRGILEAAYGSDHPAVAFTLNNLGLVMHARGELAAAEDLFRAALAIRRDKLPQGHAKIASSLSPLGSVLVHKGEAAQAEPMLREALAIRMDALAEGDWHIAQTRSVLGACLAALGRLDEARELARDGYEGLRREKGDDDRWTRTAHDRLVAVDRAAERRSDVR